MGIIRRNFTYLNCDTFLKLYKGLVRPQLEYSIPVWSPSLKKHIKSIESVQRRATSCIRELHNLDYEERLRKLKLPTLVYRRLRGDMIEAFKITSNHYDINVQNLLPLHHSIVKEHSLRGNQKKFFKKRCNLDLRKHFFTQRILPFWNSLPNIVVMAPSVKAFERRLDKHWSDQDITYNFESILNTKQRSGRRMEDMHLEDPDNDPFVH